MPGLPYKCVRHRNLFKPTILILPSTTTISLLIVQVLLDFFRWIIRGTNQEQEKPIVSLQCQKWVF